MQSGQGGLWVLIVALTAGLVGPAQARAQDNQEQKKEAGPMTEGLPQRELSKSESQKREKALLKELESHYKKWLEQEVGYIVSPEEKDAFLHLSADEEREQFIEQFWLRRDPTPDTLENEFREEHYRRIAYANERLRGWRTDRGMIYIIHGPPDEIEQMPAGGFYNRLPEEGGGGTAVLPFERWRYRYIEGVGDDIVLEFVDRCMCGDYELTMDPSLKDVLALSPGHGLSLMEMLGLSTKLDRFVGRGDATRLPKAWSETVRYNEFDRVRIHATVQKPPPIKFKDLEALVTTRVSFNLLPFEMRADFLRVTDESILVPVTIAVKKKDVTFQLREGIHQSVINVFGRVTTMTGRIVQTFEDVIRLDVPPALFAGSLQESAVYQKTVPLRPGLYKLNLVLKDLNSGNVGTLEQRLVVPRFAEEQLAHSSLILADLIEGVPAKNVGSGPFVIGDTKVRPAMAEAFRPTDKVGIYLQVYNLGIRQDTHRPDATIEYTIRRGSETVLALSETTDQLARTGEQITLEKILSLTSFPAGDYELSIKVTDRIRQQSISPSAGFRVSSR